jgi:hypothetical protein
MRSGRCRLIARQLHQLTYHYYDAGFAEPGYAKLFQDVSAQQLRRVLLFLARCYPASISKMLWNLNAPATALLIQRFEEADANPAGEGATHFPLHACHDQTLFSQESILAHVMSGS